MLLQTNLRTALLDLVHAAHESPALQLSVTGTGPWSIASPTSLVTAAGPESALSSTLSAVNLTAVASTQLLAFHAAVVTRGPTTLVIPGRSGVGKSTLTACLLRDGWAYVSDEALALDWRTGGLRAYPRPMALSPWSCAAVGGVIGLAGDGEAVVRAADLEAVVDCTPGPVSTVALLERGGVEEVPRIVVADRNDALMELLQRGFTHHRDGGRALQLTAALLKGADVVRIRLGNPIAAAQLLTDRCRT